MLLNIDKPLRTVTLHADDCTRSPDPVGTVHKPVGELGRDGGWFAVANQAEGLAVAKVQFELGGFIRCQLC